MSFSDTDRNVILCVDAAVGGGSVAISSNGKSHWDFGKTARSENLLASVNEILFSMSREIRDVTLIGVSLGPGSFTGIRIGIASAIGLAKGLGIAIRGFDTTQAVAYAKVGIPRYGVVPVGRRQFGVRFFGSDSVAAFVSDQNCVLDESQLSKLICQEPEHTFVMAKEIQLEGTADSLISHTGTNVVWADKPVALLMLEMMDRGLGFEDLSPCYAKRESN